MNLDIVDFVTREHGEKFADEWLRRSWASGAIADACAELELIEWPDDPHGGGDDLSVEIQNEIAQRVADQLRSTIAETFVRLANEILARARTHPERPMSDFDWIGSYVAFLAEEEARGGAAVRVADRAMEPVLFKDDVVRVEKLEATEDDVICVQVGKGHVFGYRTSNALRRLHGPDIPLTGNEHVVGVATVVIDREVKPRRRVQAK
jgi:hypothetical protein